MIGRRTVIDRIVFEPAGLVAWASGAGDAVGRLRRRQANLDRSMERVLASGHPRAWTDSWAPLADTGGERARLSRLGSFTTWLAGQARRLDTDGHGVARGRLSDLAAPGAYHVSGARDRYVRGTQVAGALDGRLAGGLTDRDWALLVLLANDRQFCRGLVDGLGGAVGLVDQLVAHHGARYDRVGSTAGTDPLDADRGVEQVDVLARALGLALGRATRSRDWTARDTDALVDPIRRGRGDEGFEADRASAVAVLLAHAGDVSARVVGRVVAAAVDVDRREGGLRAWVRRSRTGEDHQPWARPLLDPSGQPATDVLSTLLGVALRRPSTALDVVTTGEMASRPDGRGPGVDANLSHLLLDRHWDGQGWDRVGRLLTAAVLPNRGRRTTGTLAARVTAQAIPLLAERVRRTGALPRPLHPSTTSLLVDAMPSATFALAGTDPDAWVSDSPDPWTFVDADVHPHGLPVQPGLGEEDLSTLVDRLGSSPDQVQRLVAAAVATAELGIARELQDRHPTARVVVLGADAPVRAAGTILARARTGVEADDDSAQAFRDLVDGIGALLAQIPPGEVPGSALQLLARFGDGPRRFATAQDYAGTTGSLQDLVEHRVLDTLLVQGWFVAADVPPGAVRRVEGEVVGFDFDHGDFRDWSRSPALRDLPMGELGAQVQRYASDDDPGPG